MKKFLDPHHSISRVASLLFMPAAQSLIALKRIFDSHAFRWFAALTTGYYRSLAGSISSLPGT